MNLAQSIFHRGYLAHQAAHSAWIRKRRAADFEQVQYFCMFVGYPRSGHSLIGAMLNAHPDAVIAHELMVTELIQSGLSRNQIYARILARAYWWNLRGNRSNYKYQVPGGWQGRYRQLRVIGDKRGSTVSRQIASDPGFLQRVRAMTGVPLRLVHVIRNPFDNIAAISIADGTSLEEAGEFYFSRCAGTASLARHCPEDEVVPVAHEQMFREPQQVIAKLCRSLALEAEPQYLEDCAGIVFPSPTYTRRKVEWPDRLVREIAARIRDIPFLSEYAFDDDH